MSKSTGDFAVALTPPTTPASAEPMTTFTPAKALTWRKTASGGHALYLRDKGRALATVEPDDTHPGIWRIHQPDGWVSDMANLAWAKEGAIRTVLADLNRKETPAEAPRRGKMEAA
jgi:hypothetical protein